ncbi:MAG: aminotransferase class III-fold pyridoxal phosphate-dependent enzyme [Desulfobacteraceae bacterium]|nr:aminotransferase class III-fold pyridoxal phosphate-dependent enzyme [Desulfobacteraceae bacterium]
MNETEECYSCDWIHGGIAFHPDSLNICYVGAHDVGMPFVAKFDGGYFPLDDILKIRRKILKANQNDERHPKCRGCHFLKKKIWSKKEYLFDNIAIGNTEFCNLECNYCYLQKQDFKGFGKQFKPYSLKPTIMELIDKRLLAPDSLIDWGGGEPTFYKEFDDLLELLLSYGTYNDVHTNATQIPKSFRRTKFPERIHVVCSVDAGLPETYRRIKKRDCFKHVWCNLEEYVKCGINVTLKYIALPENCSNADLDAFIELACSIRPTSIMLDTDLNITEPSPTILNALGRLKHMAIHRGIPVEYSLTGQFFFPDKSGPNQVQAAFNAEQIKFITRSLSERGYPVSDCVDIVVENALRCLEKVLRQSEERVQKNAFSIIENNDALPKPNIISLNEKRMGTENKERKFVDGKMEYRELGTNGHKVSAVGFGTCQLRFVPEKEAINTLLKGFELGVNIVHTAPDYGNAQDLVAQAVARTERKIIVASQGYDVPLNFKGPVRHFEKLFEEACKRLCTEKLELFGIAHIENREVGQENVWGKNGMIEFLQNKKKEGRLDGIFCTTHGAPDYIKKLITSGAFDAIMLSYNILGYHLLTYNPLPDRHFENVPENRLEIFPMCKKHGVGLMIMKPLAGGILCDSKAFMSYRKEPYDLPKAKATDVLRSILVNPEVSCVLPGTACVSEAEENALSGYAPITLETEAKNTLKKRVSALTKTVCSRCGVCEPLCSQRLPIASVFGSALISLYPSVAFEIYRNTEYFQVHPQLVATCDTCENKTCNCPNGIDIPRSLSELHSQMLELMHRGLISKPSTEQNIVYGDSNFGAKVISWDIPKEMSPGDTYRCRFHLENSGTRTWFMKATSDHHCVVMAIFIEGKRTGSVRLQHNIYTHERWHLVFEMTAPDGLDYFGLRLQLLGGLKGFSELAGITVFSSNITLHKESGLSKPIDKILNRFASMQYVRKIFHRISRRIELSLNRMVKRIDDVPFIASSSSASRKSYDVCWLENNLPDSYPKGGTFQGYIQVENRGSRYWPAQHPEGNCVDLVVYINGKMHIGVRAPHDVWPGEKAIFTFRFVFPLVADNGKWVVSFSFVEHNVAWFEQNGVTPLIVEVISEEQEKGPIAETMTISRRSNWAFWLPSQGITRSSTGRPYPTFVKQAQGCYISDLEKNKWIDYVMAGGSAILGYAHSEIRNAIMKELDSSALITLPHVLEIKVSKILCEMFPCAEMAFFGKHGSDVCTAAVSMARIYTGRHKILFSGYHGWHDWYPEALEPALSPTGQSSLFRFKSNDLASFYNLVKEHSGEIAAVILEPAAQAESIDGPVKDVDLKFLQMVAEICHEENIILIFDEIITGFRHPCGSVQQDTGVVPDLACFGKALSAGMPLSALLGSREIMEMAFSKNFYHPTFRGEVYSLAAAVAALNLYKNQNVPAIINDYGSKLKNAINQLSAELNVEGEMIGVPYRMLYTFHEQDIIQRSLKRTFLQQELLKRGILTFMGYMLPSAAHGEKELEQTISAFRGALQRLQEVSAEQTFARYLDIPLMT